MYKANPTSTSILNEQLANSLLRTLIYFDVFKHPLSLKELVHFSDYQAATEVEVDKVVNELIERQLIYEHQGFYSVSKQKVRAVRRIEANKKAAPYLKLAAQLSKIIGAFPFVRAVMISGSLSKRCVYRDSDIDYVVITKENRIWFVRGVLRFLVKLLCFQRFKKFFCLNYFLDEQHLTIDLQNHYIASELVFLIPTYGEDAYHQLWENNEWVKKFYPNFPKEPTTHLASSNPNSIKRFFEWVLSNKVVDYLDRKYQQYCEKNWKKKQSKDEINQSALIEGDDGEIKSFSFTPEAFMNVFQQRISQFEQQHHISISN